MHIRALIGLATVLVSLSGCERRNLDTCRVPDLPCEDGRFCKVALGASVGKCEATECMQSSDCPTDRPNCGSGGRCYACGNAGDCTRNGNPGICDVGHCVECKTSKDCSDKSRPYCEDQTRSCRACKRHYECDSTPSARDGVCVKDDTLATLPGTQALSAGMCVPQSRVVSVDMTTCAGSCVLQDKLAEVSADKPYLRIGPFTSSATVTLRPVPGLPELHVMSTLADYSPPDPAAKDKAPNAFLTNPTGTAVSVESGASVTIEGLLIKDSKLGIACVGSGNPTRVRVQRTLIAQSNVGIQTSAGCELSLDQSWIGEGPRERYTGLANSANLLALDLDGTKFDITNSVFNHNSPAPGQFGGILVRNATASTPGRIVNTSFVRHETASAARKALVLDCNPATTNITIANSLFLNSTALAGNTYVHAACRGPNQKYIGSDDTSLTGEGNATDLVMSDVFTAPVSLGDMTLKMTADARVRDGGLVQLLDSQSGKNIIPTTDIVGAARSSTKLSLGAFEASR